MHPRCNLTARRNPLRRCSLAHLLFTLLSAYWLPTVQAQQADAATDDPLPSIQIEIADEPTAIDPARLLPEKLAARVSIEFHEVSLSDVAVWLRQATQMGVLIDGRALDDEGIIPNEPITDSLTDEPLYLLLNRLQTAGLSWYLGHSPIRTHSRRRFAVVGKLSPGAAQLEAASANGA